MVSRNTLELELWKAEEALGKIEDLELYKVLDPIVRLLEIFVGETMDAEEIVKHMQRAAEMRRRGGGPEFNPEPRDEPKMDEDASKRIEEMQAKAYL